MNNSTVFGDILKGKNGIIMGVLNDKSIAYAIAEACTRAGATIAMTYQDDSFLKRVEPLAQQLACRHIFKCDVKNDAEIETLCENLVQEKGWENIDFVVHSIAFSDKSELSGYYMHTTRGNFLNTMDISCYSLVAVTRCISKYMKNGSILTLSYYGSEKVVPNYNVMGVAKAALEASVRYLAVDLGADSSSRINAISAGPINTLAARGISDFNSILEHNRKNSALRRNTDAQEVAKTAVFLLSDLSTGITGELVHVDAGASIIGVPLDVTN